MLFKRWLWRGKETEDGGTQIATSLRWPRPTAGKEGLVESASGNGH